MNNEDNKTPGQQVDEQIGKTDATVKKTLEMGAEAYAKAEKAVGEVYDKTADAVNKTYEQAGKFSAENPATTILIALGIGVGLGFLLGVSARRGGSARFARPVVNALSDIASEYFR